MVIGQYTRSSKYETEAFISHAADAVCEHQISAVVPPAAALRQQSLRSARDLCI